MGIASFNDFLALDIRVGKVTRVEYNTAVREPAYKIWVNFGQLIGEKKTSAQLVQNYSIEDLLDRKVLAIINFPPKQIADFMSEILILANVDKRGKNALLIVPDSKVQLGSKLA